MRRLRELSNYTLFFYYFLSNWIYLILPIISGAFGIFRTDLVRQIGGFRPHAVGEDFDLVVRLHRFLQEQDREYHINFIPDPTCWTEVPPDLRSLARQRARWHKGLLDTLWPNRDMLFRWRYGPVGSLILPYMWIFELFEPLVEIAGYSSIVVAACLGLLSRQFFVLFLIFGYAFATLISIGAVLLEEMTIAVTATGAKLRSCCCTAYLSISPIGR